MLIKSQSHHVKESERGSLDLPLYQDPDQKFLGRDPSFIQILLETIP